MTGLVTANNGNRYTVLLDDGLTVTCAAKGNLRIKGIRTTNPVAVGDHVEVIQDPGSPVAFISRILPRRNYIIRRASNLSKESHILAANLDQGMLICSLVHPATSTTFIDRFLATAEAYSVPAILVINKADLLDDDHDGKQLLQAVKHLYESIGYPVIVTSTVTGEGMDTLAQATKGKTTLLSGNSGVGKSSIINALVPEADTAVANISRSHDSGMHTTTFSRMYPLPGGGYLIDTPGVRGFGTIDFDPHEVGHFFPEIFRASSGCRFSDCLHTGSEPGCQVVEDVAQHLISQSRYASYLSILQGDAQPGQNKYR